MESFVHQPFPIQPPGQPGSAEQIDRSLFEQSGPNPLLDVFPAAPLDHDRLDAMPGKQV
jgi:hypothetical protein